MEEQTTLYNNHIKTEMRNIEATENNAEPTPKDRINQKMRALSNTIKSAAESHFEKKFSKAQTQPDPQN